MYIRYDFFESHYIGVPIIGRDLSKVKTKVLNQRYNWTKFHKEIGPPATGRGGRGGEENKCR